MIVERKRGRMKPWKELDYELLWQLNEQGLHYMEMAKELKRTSGAVQIKMVEKGWEYKHKKLHPKRGNPGKEYVPNISKTILKHKNGKLVNYSSNKDYNQSWRI